MLRAWMIAAVLAMTAGCASTNGPGYDWGKYDELLYRSYKDPQQAEALRVSLDAHVRAVEQQGKRPPPGLYAELGTAYLQMGDTASAVSWYSKEWNAWPESRALMETLIRNIKRRDAERMSKEGAE